MLPRRGCRYYATAGPPYTAGLPLCHGGAAVVGSVMGLASAANPDVPKFGSVMGLASVANPDVPKIGSVMGLSSEVNPDAPKFGSF